MTVIRYLLMTDFLILSVFSLFFFLGDKYKPYYQKSLTLFLLLDVTYNISIVVYTFYYLIQLRGNS